MNDYVFENTLNRRKNQLRYGFGCAIFSLNPVLPSTFSNICVFENSNFSEVCYLHKGWKGTQSNCNIVGTSNWSFRPLLAASLVKALILSNNFFANLDLLKAIGSRYNGSATSLVISIFSSKAKTRAWD